MKKYIFIIIAIVAIYYAWDYIIPQKESVEVSPNDIKDTKLKGDSLIDANNRMREDLFQVLVLMNEVTVNTMQLERYKEEGNKANMGTLNQQLDGKMELLKEQLEEARKHLKENKELTEELNRLEQSYRKRMSTIRNLQMEDNTLDEQLKKAISDLETENDNLRNEEAKLEQKNSELRKVISNRKQAELNSWEFAGDELIEAARIIPKANSTLFAGKQSREITRSKQMVLKSATECYNSAIRLGNSYGNVKGAKNAYNKAMEADRLFNLVTDYKSIGEETYEED